MKKLISLFWLVALCAFGQDPGSGIYGRLIAFNVTTTQRLALTNGAYGGPGVTITNGLIVYDSTLGTLFMMTNGVWGAIQAGTGGGGSLTPPLTALNLSSPTNGGDANLHFPWFFNAMSPATNPTNVTIVDMGDSTMAPQQGAIESGYSTGLGQVMQFGYGWGFWNFQNNKLQGWPLPSAGTIVYGAIDTTWGGIHWLIPPGESVTNMLYNNSAFVAFTNVDTISLAYVTGAAYSTDLQLQTIPALNGSPATLLDIDTQNAATVGILTNVQLAPSTVAVRIYNNGSANAMVVGIGAAIKTNGHTFTMNNFSLGGQRQLLWTNVPTNISTPIFRALNPALVLVTDRNDNSNQIGAGWSNYLAYLTNAFPYADIVSIGTYQSLAFAGMDDTGFNLPMRTNTIAAGLPYIDLFSDMPSSFMMSNLNWWIDGLHLKPSTVFEGGVIWHRLSQSLGGIDFTDCRYWLTPPMTNGVFYGQSIFETQNAKDNPGVGIGPLVTIGQQQYPGSGNTYSYLGFGPSHTNSAIYQATGSPSVLFENSGGIGMLGYGNSTGSIFQVGMPSLTWFADGSVTIGVSGGAPLGWSTGVGLNNLAVQGTVQSFGGLIGPGSLVSNLNASQLTSGTVSTSRIGTLLTNNLAASGNGAQGNILVESSTTQAVFTNGISASLLTTGTVPTNALLSAGSLQAQGSSLVIGATGAIVATNASAGGQTPWTSDINGGGFKLTNTTELVASNAHSRILIFPTNVVISNIDSGAFITIGTNITGTNAAGTQTFSLIADTGALVTAGNATIGGAVGTNTALVGNLNLGGNLNNTNTASTNNFAGTNSFKGSNTFSGQVNLSGTFQTGGTNAPSGQMLAANGSGGASFRQYMTPLQFMSIASASVAASTNHYLGSLISAVPGTSNSAAAATDPSNYYVVVPFTGVINRVEINIRQNGTLGTHEPMTNYLMKVNGGVYSAGWTNSCQQASGNLSETNGLNFSVTAGDQLVWKIYTPAWGTTPTATFWNATAWEQ